MRPTKLALAMSLTLTLVACSSGGDGTTGTTTKPVTGGSGAAGSGATSSTGSPTASDTTVAKEPLDASLVGQWYAGRGGTMTSYDPVTGQMGQGSGTGMLFVFQADGSYVKAVQSIEDGPCSMGYVTTESGAVFRRAGRLELHAAHGNMHTITCNHTGDKDEPLDVHDATLSYALAPYSVDPSIDGITLTDENGASAEFRRTR